MLSADIWTVRKSTPAQVAGGEPVWRAYDHWGTAFAVPALDSGRQDVELLQAGTGNGSTTAVFRRLLDTCEDQQDRR